MAALRLIYLLARLQPTGPKGRVIGGARGSEEPLFHGLFVSLYQDTPSGVPNAIPLYFVVPSGAG